MYTLLPKIGRRGRGGGGNERGRRRRKVLEQVNKKYKTEGSVSIDNNKITLNWIKVQIFEWEKDGYTFINI